MTQVKFIDWWKRFWTRARATGRALADNPFSLSAIEAIVVFLLSNAALPFYVFVHLVGTKNEIFSFALAVRLIISAVSPNEIFVYLLALIAPALWVMLYRWRGRRHPIFFGVLLFAQFILVATCAYIYGLAKIGGQMNPEFVRIWATGCYVAGIVIWYITLVYDKLLAHVIIPQTPQSGAQIMAEL